MSCCLTPGAQAAAEEDASAGAWTVGVKKKPSSSRRKKSSSTPPSLQSQRPKVTLPHQVSHTSCTWKSVPDVRMALRVIAGSAPRSKGNKGKERRAPSARVLDARNGVLRLGSYMQHVMLLLGDQDVAQLLYHERACKAAERDVKAAHVKLVHLNLDDWKEGDDDGWRGSGAARMLARTFKVRAPTRAEQ